MVERKGEGRRGSGRREEREEKGTDGKEEKGLNNMYAIKKQIPSLISSNPHNPISTVSACPHRPPPKFCIWSVHSEL